MVLLTFILGVVALSGCTTTAQLEAEQREACYATQTRIKAEMDRVNDAKGAYPDIERLVISLNVACPAGGTFEFDPIAETVSCTKHGAVSKK
jgi:uncharacterized protein YceK